MELFGPSCSVKALWKHCESAWYGEPRAKSIPPCSERVLCDQPVPLQTESPSSSAPCAITKIPVGRAAETGAKCAQWKLKSQSVVQCSWWGLASPSSKVHFSLMKQLKPATKMRFISCRYKKCLYQVSRSHFSSYAHGHSLTPCVIDVSNRNTTAKVVACRLPFHNRSGSRQHDFILNVNSLKLYGNSKKINCNALKCMRDWTKLFFFFCCKGPLQNFSDIFFISLVFKHCTAFVQL